MALFCILFLANFTQSGKKQASEKCKRRARNWLASLARKLFDLGFGKARAFCVLVAAFVAQTKSALLRVRMQMRLHRKSHSIRTRRANNRKANKSKLVRDARDKSFAEKKFASRLANCVTLKPQTQKAAFANQQKRVFFTLEFCNWQLFELRSKRQKKAAKVKQFAAETRRQLRQNE